MVKTDTTLQPPSVWCFMSFVLDGSFLRCRGVPVSWISSSSLWTSPLRDAESRAAKEHRSCLGLKTFRCWSINLVSRSHWSLSCFLLPLTTRVVAYWYCEKKTQAFSLTPFLPLYNAIELCSFFLGKKEKKRQREALPAGEKTDTCAF